MVSAIIFDMDGVIVDTEPLHFIALKRVLKEFNIDIPDTSFMDYFGISEESIWKKTLKKYSIKMPFNSFETKRRQHLFEVLEESLELAKGTLRLLKQLKKNRVRIALVTSSGRDVVDFILNKLDISGFFEIIVSSDDVKEKKPNPEPYRLALDRLGLKPDDCAVIEDSKYGVESAKGAGIFCIGLRNKNYENAATEADLLIWSLEELTIAKMNNLEKAIKIK